LGLVGLSFCFSTGQWLFDQEGEWCSVASDDLASTIPRPQPNWDDLEWVGPQSEGKAANKCSACVRMPSRLLEKHSRWSWLREYQACAKAVTAKGGYFEESQVYNVFGLIKNVVTTCFHMCCFIVWMSLLLFYNVENSLKNKSPWMSSCPNFWLVLYVW
jgi:hypothetical protein